MDSENKISITRIIIMILSIAAIILCIMGSLEIHKAFVLGFERDCVPYIEQGVEEHELPGVCQDYGKYHLMLMAVVVILTGTIGLTTLMLTGTNQNLQNDTRRNQTG